MLYTSFILPEKNGSRHDSNERKCRAGANNYGRYDASRRHKRRLWAKSQSVEIHISSGGWVVGHWCTAAGGWWTGSARSVSLFHAPQKSPNSRPEKQRSFVSATWRVSTSRAEIESRCGGRQDRSRSIVVITNSVSGMARDDFAFTSPTGRRPAGDV